MIWYLIFCSAVRSGVVCTSPEAMPSKEACHFVGQQMVETKNELYRHDGAKYKCVGVKKP